jgi:hypothetical protein
MRLTQGAVQPVAFLGDRMTRMATCAGIALVLSLSASAIWIRQQSRSAPGQFHKALLLRLDEEGMKNPLFRELDEVPIEDNEVVFGIVVDGKAIAFHREVFLENHILNFMTEHRPISVTYCDIAKCCRVFTSDAEQPVSLRVGGLDVDEQLVLLLDGIRYGQSNQAILLVEIPHEIMTFASWRAKHPESTIFTWKNLAF